jgi:hypothetical protein
MQFRYSPDFIKRVRSSYIGRADVLEALQDGTMALGKLLEDGAIFQMSPDEMIASFREGRPSVVLSAALQAKERQRLYTDWVRQVLQAAGGFSTKAERP